MSEMYRIVGIEYSKYVLLILAVLICFDDAPAKSRQTVERGYKESRYEITIRKEDPLTAHVKARLNVNDTLSMSTNCPNYDYPEGWSSFVKDLKIKQPLQYVNFRD